MDRIDYRFPSIRHAGHFRIKLKLIEEFFWRTAEHACVVASSPPPGGGGAEGPSVYKQYRYIPRNRVYGF